MKKTQSSIIDSNCIITHVSRALLSHSGTQLSNIKDNALNVPELSTNLVNCELTISDKDVYLSIQSDYFKSQSFIVGIVRQSDIIISDCLSMIAGLNIYRVCLFLSKHGEDEPMKLFNIHYNYCVCVDCSKEQQQKMRKLDYIQNTLF